MMSLSDDKQADVIDALNTTSRYLDDILNINNVYCLLLSKQQTFRWNFSEIRSCALHSEILLSEATRSHCYK